MAVAAVVAAAGVAATAVAPVAAAAGDAPGEEEGAAMCGNKNFLPQKSMVVPM